MIYKLLTYEIIIIIKIIITLLYHLFSLIIESISEFLHKQMFLSEQKIFSQNITTTSSFKKDYQYVWCLVVALVLMLKRVFFKLLCVNIVDQFSILILYNKNEILYSFIIYNRRESNFNGSSSGNWERYVSKIFNKKSVSL